MEVHFHAECQGNVRQRDRGAGRGAGSLHRLPDLSFMDSSGIGVLLGRLRILQQRGGTLSVKNMQPPIEKLFRLTGLQRVIAVEHHQRGGRQ